MIETLELYLIYVREVEKDPDFPVSETGMKMPVYAYTKARTKRRLEWMGEKKLLRRMEEAENVQGPILNEIEIARLKQIKKEKSVQKNWIWEFDLFSLPEAVCDEEKNSRAFYPEVVAIVESTQGLVLHMAMGEPKIHKELGVKNFLFDILEKSEALPEAIRIEGMNELFLPSFYILKELGLKMDSSKFQYFDEFRESLLRDGPGFGKRRRN